MPIKLVCFDLDFTVLNGRLHRSLEEAGVKPGCADAATVDAHLEAIGGIKNKEALKATMRGLLAAGVNIAITSFTGYPETIPLVLQRIGLRPDEIARIQPASYHPAHIDMKEYGKNNHIQRAIEAFGGNIAPQEVVLVDDNIQNYELAKQKGYNVIWVQGSEGRVDYLNELREMTGLSAQSALQPLAQAQPAPPPQSWVDKMLGWIGLQRAPAIG